MRVRPFILCWITVSLLVGGARAQDRPVAGVVWTPPSSVEQGVEALRAMHDQGVEAVRTPPVRDERLLAEADTLGLQVYQDLPLRLLSAQALDDTLDHARVQLDRMLSVAQRHPSARHFGLGDRVDTSDPATCAALQQLAAVVRSQGPPGSQTYYVTPFTAADRCAPAVDLTLLDALSAERPAQRLAAWQAAHPDARGGLGALGTWVRGDTLRGLRVPHSPERQARYLERHLASLQADTLQRAPAAVFVYRWRDASAPPSDPYGRPYGLHTARDAPRPAADVVAGFFTGTQTVFAFSAGSVPRLLMPWLILMGWGAVGLLAVVYFRSPRLQQMAARYFGAHNFYQESVREGREMLVGSTLAIMGGGLAGLAALGTVLGRCFQDALPVRWALGALPDALQPAAAALMGRPGVLGIIVAAAYGVALLLWMGGLLGVSRSRAALAPRQIFMTVSWPHWPLWAVLVAALAVSSFSPAAGRPLALWLLAGTGGVLVWITGRVLADVAAVARVPAVLALLAGLISPLLLGVWTGLALVAYYDVPVEFINHLLTRT